MNYRLHLIVLLVMLILTHDGLTQYGTDDPSPNLLHLQINRPRDFVEVGTPKSRWDKAPTFWNYTLCHTSDMSQRVLTSFNFSDNPEMLVSDQKNNIKSFPEIIAQYFSHPKSYYYKDFCFDDALHDSLPEGIDLNNVEYIVKSYIKFDWRAKVYDHHLYGLHIVRNDSLLVNLYFPTFKYSTLKEYSIPVGDDTISYVDYFEDFILHTRPVGDSRKFYELPHYSIASCEEYVHFEKQGEFDAHLVFKSVITETQRRLEAGADSASIPIIGYIPDTTIARVTTIDKEQNKIEVNVFLQERLLLTFGASNLFADGEFKEFYPNGILKETGTFDRGLRVGTWKNYHSNGNLKSVRHYENGVLSGLQRVYHPNGNPYLIYEVKDGEYHGLHEEYYPDGRIKASGQMKDGFIIDGWFLSILVTDSLKKYIENNIEKYEFPASAIEDNYLEYNLHITYLEDKEYLPLDKDYEQKVIGDFR